MLHDTHVHLEMLLSKLDLLGDMREYDEDSAEAILTDEAKSKLTELISNHEFLLHSTVSTKNFAYVTNLFKDFSKIKYFFGSHPEIVNSDFDLDKYLEEQPNFIENNHIFESIKQNKTNRMSSQREVAAKLTEGVSPIINVASLINSKTVIQSIAKDPLTIENKTQPTQTQKETQTIVGIGEVGLDYHYTQDPELIAIQKKLFQSQIELAIKYNLPLMIHCRDAFDDLFEILEKYPAIHGKFLIHCFTGGIDEMYRAIKIGGKIAFGGVITFKSAREVQEAVEYCPLESFVLETDLPFLSPKRGEICIPEHIDLVAEKVAEIKKIPKQEVWEWSRRNCKELIGVNLQIFVSI